MSAYLTVAEFRARFPEFTSTIVGDAVVQARLDEAAIETPKKVWGDLTTTGHGWLTAHLLSSSGYGREVNKDGTTSYGRRFDRLAEVVGIAAAPRTT